MIVINHHRSTYYHNACCELASSLTIKSLATAFLMNGFVDEYTASQNLPPLYRREDQRTWRYYHHLAGEYHPYDLHKFGYMKVKSLDTLQIIDFTKENLQKHRATLAHYHSQGEFYWDLVKRYPDLHILIDGICRPVDKQTAIEAKEYDILSYRKELVESQENYLISTLEHQIKQMMLAYDSHNYSVFIDGYDMLKLGILGTQLPGMIIAIREQYVGTPFAHSFHIWSYLGSYFELDRYKPYLTFKQAMWLYRHLRYVDISAGRTKTFDDLIQVLLTDRAIPLYGFSLENNLEGKNVIRDQLNMNDRNFMIDDSELTVEKLYDKEKEQARRNDEFRDTSIALMDKLLEKTTNTDRQTKLLESVVFDYGSRELYPLGGIAVNYWAWMAFTNRYDLRGSLTNPLTGDLFTLTAKDAFILWFYLANRLINPYDKMTVTNMKIPTFTALGIFDEQLNWNEVRYHWTNKKIRLKDYHDEMERQAPRVMPIVSSGQFRELVEKIQSYRLFLKHLESAYDGLHGATEIEHLHARMFHRYNLVLVDDEEMTFGQWMTSKNWNFESLKREDCALLAGRIYAYFTTATNDGNSSALEEMQKAMIAIFRQLSSYSIQFISKTHGQNSQIIDSPIIRWGLDKTSEESFVKIMTKYIPKWENITAFEKGNIPLNLGIGSIDGDDLETWEQDTVAALEPYPLSISGRGMTLREVRLHLPGWRTLGMGGFDPDRLVKNNHYLFNGTLYQWRSRYLKEQPMFEIKRGQPYEEPDPEQWATQVIADDQSGGGAISFEELYIDGERTGKILENETAKFLTLTPDRLFKVEYTAKDKISPNYLGYSTLADGIKRNNPDLINSIKKSGNYIMMNMDVIVQWDSWKAGTDSLAIWSIEAYDSVVNVYIVGDNRFKVVPYRNDDITEVLLSLFVLNAYNVQLNIYFVDDATLTMEFGLTRDRVDRIIPPHERHEEVHWSTDIDRQLDREDRMAWIYARAMIRKNPMQSRVSVYRISSKTKKDHKP